jgi:exonuclease I
MEIIKSNLAKLKKAKGFSEKLVEALSIPSPKSQTILVINEQEVDGQLYDNFVNGEDKTKMRVVRAAKPEELSNAVNFSRRAVKTFASAL